MSTVAKAIAALVIAGSLAGSGVILWQHHTKSAQRERSEEFAAAAKEGIVALTSLNFNHARDDVQRIIDSLTGSFRDDFQARANDFVKVVETSKVVAQARSKRLRCSRCPTTRPCRPGGGRRADHQLGRREEGSAGVTAQRDGDPDGDRFKLAKVELVP